MGTAADSALGNLLFLKTSASSSWEQTLIEIALSLLKTGGMAAVSELEGAMTGFLRGSLTPDQLRTMIGEKLSLRDASDLLVVLENAEADKIERTRAILRDVLSAATVAAEALLKAALGGLL